LGEWQKDELLGKDIVYLIALNQGYEKDTEPTSEDLAELRDYLDVEAEAWLLDIDGQQTGVTQSYCAEEPTGDCTASVNVVLDQQLRVRFLGATHERDGSNALDVMLDLVE